MLHFAVECGWLRQSSFLYRSASLRGSRSGAGRLHSPCRLPSGFQFHNISAVFRGLSVRTSGLAVSVQILCICFRTVEAGSIVIVEEGQQAHWMAVDDVL